MTETTDAVMRAVGHWEGSARRYLREIEPGPVGAVVLRVAGRAARLAAGLFAFIYTVAFAHLFRPMLQGRPALTSTENLILPYFLAMVAALAGLAAASALFGSRRPALLGVAAQAALGAVMLLGAYSLALHVIGPGDPPIGASRLERSLRPLEPPVAALACYDAVLMLTVAVGAWRNVRSACVLYWTRLLATGVGMLLIVVSLIPASLAIGLAFEIVAKFSPLFAATTPMQALGSAPPRDAGLVLVVLLIWFVMTCLIWGTAALLVILDGVIAALAVGMAVLGGFIVIDSSSDRHLVDALEFELAFAGDCAEGAGKFPSTKPQGFWQDLIDERG